MLTEIFATCLLYIFTALDYIFGTRKNFYNFIFFLFFGVVVYSIGNHMGREHIRAILYEACNTPDSEIDIIGRDGVYTCTRNVE